MKNLKISQQHKLANFEQGFTLVELMISLTLGLIITAAVFQVYFMSTQTSVIQAAGSDIVDANIFGLHRVEDSLKMAGLGLSEDATGIIAGSGVVIAPANLTGITIGASTPVSTTLMTMGETSTAGTGNQWTGVSNTNQPSDQLTIQYRAPQNQFDCEGQFALGPREVNISGVPTIIDGQIIIERYFLRQVGNDIVLACDAGRYITEDMDDYSEQGDPNKNITVFTAKNQIKNFGDAGEVLISNIDDFQVLLGVMTTTGIQYVTPSQYMSTSAPVVSNLPIVSIKLGIIARGNTPLPGSDTGSSSFELLGQATTLKSGVSANIIRRDYESNVMLRNSRQPTL